MSFLTPRLVLLFCSLVGAATVTEAKADDEAPTSATLDPVYSSGTPAESLKFDPVVPAYTAKTKGDASTGNIAKELSNDLPFHTDSNFKPGNEVGVIGIGKGPEETDVNILGIPINRPEGGGADLSTFPEYFWSGYSYQIGPSLGAFDPRGVGGSLTLRLWTQENLGFKSERATAFWSSRHIEEFSYAKSGKRYAILAGMTTDSVVGPALSFSGVALETGSTKITTHLLFSETDAKDFVSERSASTTASQNTYRLIPVVQVDHKIGSALLKTSFFYDQSYIDYEDSADPTAKQIKKIFQVGNETAYLFNGTRAGFGLRNVVYERDSEDSNAAFPSEQVLNVQLDHEFRWATSEKSNLLIQPMLGGYAVSREGFFPTGSLGIRQDHVLGENGKCGEFLRVGYTRRFPSLLDRYYSFSEAVSSTTTLEAFPNPSLQPEEVRSVEMGADFTQGSYKNQLTFFLRGYKHARYTRTFTVESSPETIIGFQLTNAGDAWVTGFTQSQDWKALPILDVGTRLTFQHSRIDDLQAEFPYSPDWVGIVKADLHVPDNRYGLEVVNKAATNFLAYSETEGTPTELPSYYYLDLFFRAEVVPGVTVTAGVEDVFDHAIQYRLTDPDEGRVYSVAATGTF